MSVRSIFTRPARSAVIAPYLWMLLFFLVPFGFVFKISLSQTAIAQPPYTPVFELTAGWQGIENFLGALSLDNYAFLGSDPLYVLSYVKSLQIASFSTLLLLVIGYPIAYAITRLPRRLQAVLVLLVMLPFWTSFLIRTYALKIILDPHGYLARDLGINIMYTKYAVAVGLVYNYLPLMIFPLYVTLERLVAQWQFTNHPVTLASAEITLRDLVGSHTDDVLTLLDRFEANHPRDTPHYYLSLLGTHPSHRGRGHVPRRGLRPRLDSMALVGRAVGGGDADLRRVTQHRAAAGCGGCPGWLGGGDQSVAGRTGGAPAPYLNRSSAWGRSSATAPGRGSSSSGPGRERSWPRRGRATRRPHGCGRTRRPAPTRRPAAAAGRRRSPRRRATRRVRSRFRGCARNTSRSR